MAKKEEWRDVVGYEGLYEVSDTGKIRSFYRIRNGGILYKRKRIYYPRFHSGHSGHLAVWLYKDGKGKKWLVHRLVAMAFISNPYNLPFINHKDEIPYHNNVDNLEWCTPAYNNSYGTIKERMSKALMNRPDMSMVVIRIDKYGNKKEYVSMQEAARQNGLNQPNIWKCCNGIYHTCGGYKWTYK